ncbi:MAG: hypothetical protein R3D71_09040 [Rickettsiales bacterium]
MKKIMLSAIIGSGLLIGSSANAKAGSIFHFGLFLPAPVAVAPVVPVPVYETPRVYSYSYYQPYYYGAYYNGGINKKHHRNYYKHQRNKHHAEYRGHHRYHH